MWWKTCCTKQNTKTTTKNPKAKQKCVCKNKKKKKKNSIQQHLRHLKSNPMNATKKKKTEQHCEGRLTLFHQHMNRININLSNKDILAIHWYVVARSCHLSNKNFRFIFAFFFFWKVSCNRLCIYRYRRSIHAPMIVEWHGKWIR